MGIQARGNSIQFNLPRQWAKDGNQARFMLGLPNTSENWAIAEAIARQMERDHVMEALPETVEGIKAKYLPKSHLTVVEAIKPIPAIALPELWSQYIETKRPTCAPGTWKNGYLVMTRHLESCPHSTLDDSQKIYDWAIATLTPDTAKRFIMQMSACCKWARRSHLISQNPFDSMPPIKVPKSSEEEDDINPFTKEEQERIITAFQSSKYYRPYASLIQFLFMTGCRPSEAIALQWRNYKGKDIHFERVAVAGVNGLEIVNKLKTQEKRRFPVNAQLQQLLERLSEQEHNQDSLIFPSPEGKIIDFHNFRNRGWVKILESLSIEYRKPYQTRHTFITQCLDSGISVQQVAKWVGNSPSVIMEHYAGTNRHIQVPEF
ncbi:tyrosine-type recombinase/integrase [Phormidesmis sp. 146-35]